MEQQRVIRNSIAIFLLTIISVQYVVSLSENSNNSTNNVDSINDDQVVTTYSPISINISKNSDTELSETKSPDQYGQSSDHHEVYTSEDNDDSIESEDHTIPYSEHEEARNVPTKPKYIAPGIWAKPPPDKRIPLDFVPSKLHAQVRGTHTVKRLPQREAIRDAKSDEERHNAPRLKAIVTNSKINTVYTEEGYEDSAYDHAGHIRDADFHEGHARKLHDRKNSGKLIGKRKNEQLIPKEFQEYDDDGYQNRHHEENSKLEESSDSNDNSIDGRIVWKGSAIDPKLVAENGIEQLKKDTENDAEETERNSMIYRNKQESRIKNDIKNDSSQSKENHHHDDDDSITDEENESTVTERKKPSNRKDSMKKERVKQTIKNRKQKLHPMDYESTTLMPFNDTANSAAKVEIFTDPADFVTNSQTTLYHIAPVSTTPFYQTDHPTTISYGQIFWDYFKKTKQSPSTVESTFTSDPLTLNSQSDGRIPITMTTMINGFVETSTILPSTFLDSTRNFHPQKLFPDTVELDPSTSHRQNRRLLGQSESVNHIGDNPLATSTFSAAGVEPLLLHSLQSLNTENTEYPSSTISLDETESNSTPVTINITNEAYSRMPDYLVNPFFSSMLDNSNIVVNRNKSKYKVLVRPKLKKSNKSAIYHKQNSPLSTIAEEEKKNNGGIIKQDYIGNTKPPGIRSFVENQELIVEEDLTRMRPPIPQQILYPFFSADRPPAIDYSSMSIESESPQFVAEPGKSLLRNQHRSQSTKSPSRFNSLAIVQPAYHQTGYHANSLPATELLPPSPLATTHNNYHNYVSYVVSGKPQKHDNTFKYHPLSPAVNWRTRSRRKRSGKIDEFHNVDRNDRLNVKAARDNDNVTNDSVSEDKDSFNRTVRRMKRKSWSRGIIDVSADLVVPDTRKLTTTGSVTSENSTVLMNSRSMTNGENKNADIRQTDTKSIKRGPVLFQPEIQNVQKYNIDTTSTEEQVEERKINVTRKMNRREHEELLNESPKISGDVIEKEIAVRFNVDNSNDKSNNVTSAKEEIKDEEKIEVDVPNFDYAEELAENDHVESSVTTTEVSSVDTKKYPFYNNEDLPSASALRYVVDPRTIPRKTSRGMEFYDSRNAYKQCDEIDHNLDKILPKKEEPDPDRGPRENLPRLRGLGDKLDCFKAKYFDENPFDNPLFAEKVVEEPTRPPELNPVQFASKIVLFPREKDEYVVHQISRRPERNGRQWRNRNRDYETHESIRVNYKHDPLTGRGRNAYLHSVRSMLPFNTPRRVVKNRRGKLKITTTTPQSPRSYQTASYQNQVYEDVMGNIRNMAKAYQVYEITTLPTPSTQSLASAGSEITLKVSSVTPSLQQEKDNKSLLNTTDSTNNSELLEIKGLLPPKYSTPRRASYRKHRPEANNNRIALLQSLNLPQIIAHYHSIKMNKRSVTMDNETNTSVSNVTNEDRKDKIEETKEADNIGNIVTTTSMEIDTIGNDTTEKSFEDISKKANSSIIGTSDLTIGESRQINKQKQNLSTRRRNPTSNDWKTESPERIVYTIRDRIRYSKPKWDAKRFDKFDRSLKSVDEDSRRKEPRYNNFKTRKLTASMRNNSINSGISGIESTTVPMRIQQNDQIELCDSRKSIGCQSVFGRKNQYSEPDNAESIIDADLKDHNSEEESETTPNVYRVHENVDEDVSTTTTGLINSFSSKEAQNLREYLKSDPPGYAETFPEEATTLSSPYAVNYKLEDKEDEKDEQINYRKKNQWNDDSSEKAEEQMEIPMNTPSLPHDENFEQPASEEKKISSEVQTLSSAESEKDDERSEKVFFHRPYKFPRYRSKEESDEDASEEESKEKNEDRVFPWHADKEDKHKGSQDFYNYEYPWERRERLARERRRKRKRANRFKKFSFDNNDDEEEDEKSSTSERPIYPWERYNVPSENHKNTRHNISPKETDDSEESKEIKKLPGIKFSSRYSSDNVKSSPKLPSSALEVSKSITKFLEDEPNDKSEEETSEEIEDRSSSPVRRSSSFERKGISRRTLVPEDITQPSSRRNGKTRVSKIDNDVLRTSRFDSKKLKERDIDRDEEEESEMEVSAIKSDNTNNVDNAESGTLIAKNRLNQTKEVSSVTGQRKKRRRIHNNNSTISHDNAATESVAKSIKKKRRNPRVSIIMSATPSTNDDLDTSKSAYTPVRQRYLKTDDMVKFDKSNSSGKTAGTIDIEDTEMESSTPKIRTIEHRSRVSKEQLVTKTTYPDKVEENKDFNTDSNDRMNKQSEHNRNGKVTYSNVENVKTLRIPRKPGDKNKDGSLKNVDSKNTRFKKTSSVDSFDSISDNDDGELKRMTSSEVSLFITDTILLL